MDTEQQSQACSFNRRIVIMFYDAILLFSVLFVATIIILPLTKGEAVPSHNLLYFFYLFLLRYLYFTWQWTHGGQTLGMKSWKVQLQEINQIQVSWENASLRFILAIPSIFFFGLGLVWFFFDSEKQSAHDRYSNTRLLMQKPEHKG